MQQQHATWTWALTCIIVVPMCKLRCCCEALLSWCALNSLVVMNTMFEKKNIHKYTWQHPGSKQWHCIDYIIMRQKQRSWCCDVSVLRSADCWTDHKLLRAQMKLQHFTRRKNNNMRKKYDISALQSKEISRKFS